MYIAQPTGNCLSYSEHILDQPMMSSWIASEDCAVHLIIFHFLLQLSDCSSLVFQLFIEDAHVHDNADELIRNAIRTSQDVGCQQTVYTHR